MVSPAVGAGSSPPLEAKRRAAGGAEERLLRRSLGPTASAVLVDLCLDAETDADGVVVVRTSARRVAENLGIGKDTAARALLRLSASGLTRRRRQEIDGRGRFAATTYELQFAPGMSPFPRPGQAATVERSCLDYRDAESDSSPVSAPAPAVAPAPNRRRKRTPGGAHIDVSGGNQLRLLDPGTVGVDPCPTEPSS